MDLPNSLCFLDLETTGQSSSFGRVIEVGVVKVVNGQVISEYQRLINPEIELDPFIQNLTGITGRQLENAPTFAQIKDELWELLSDGVLVAHNVRFDYSFLRKEFRRIGINFCVTNFCTIRLGKQLFPDWKHFNLDAVSEKMGIRIENRHRALDDAKAIFEFYQKCCILLPEKQFTEAVNKVLKIPKVPKDLAKDQTTNLPETAGAFLFYDANNKPLFVGTGKNLKDRIEDYFFMDSDSEQVNEMIAQAVTIETIPTGSELGAVLLESQLIKANKPVYNRRVRLDEIEVVCKKRQNKDGYLYIETSDNETLKPEDYPDIISIYRNEKHRLTSLKKAALEHNLCPSLLGLEDAIPCSFYRTGECFGACKGEENVLKYNLRFTEAFYYKTIRPWPFAGPVVVGEPEEDGDNFLIDQWCYLGKYRKGEYPEITLDQYSFDYELYHVLKKYLLDDKNQGKIRVVNSVSTTC